MKAFSFNVTIAAEALDCEVIEDTIRQALTDGLPDDTLALCKADGVKEAGDAHKASKAKVETEVATA